MQRKLSFVQPGTVKLVCFNFLAAKVSGYDKAGLQFFVQRSNKTTVLHIAIISQHFGKR
jgi:hypothetical protein